MVSVKHYKQLNTSKDNQILNAFTRDINGDKEFHITVGNSVPIADLEFVLIHIMYNLIIRYIKYQDKPVTIDNFNKALLDYVQAIKAQAGSMYDLNHEFKDEVE